MRESYVVVYLSKHLLGRDYQAHDLPYGHLEVHLRELEEPLEEARHFDLIAPRGWRGRAEVGGPACWAGKSDVWVHLVYAPACLCFGVVVQAALKLPGRRVRVFGEMFRVRPSRRGIHVNALRGERAKRSSTWE
jgi:hypothetical protein